MTHALGVLIYYVVLWTSYTNCFVFNASYLVKRKHRLRN